MEFRPCIDIHNGKVKQIVGGTLTDHMDLARENFVSEQDAAFYAAFYKKNNLRGGHIILLNPADSDYYEATRNQAISALQEYPNGLQVGGGITADNAEEYLQAGASHVIITSYIFKNGQILYSNLDRLVGQIGKEKLVIDLSCRKKDGYYYIVTDRWQKYTDVRLDHQALNFFKEYCSEFLIHAVDVEGKAEGIEEELVQILGECDHIPITYAGGVHNLKDLQNLKKIGKNRINVTIGSALDLFGGSMKWKEVIEYMSDTV